MKIENIFNESVKNTILERINQLNPDTKALWGKMDAAQMLAHCCVTYEYIFDNIHPRPGFLIGFLLKKFVKKYVVSDQPYKKGSATAKEFIKQSKHDFELEKKRLVDYIEKTYELGINHFDQKESHSFGVLTKEEWNAMFYKHLVHHLSQFGV